MTDSSHRDLILDQFTRQATPFSTAKTIASEEALRLLVDACGAGPDDTVLDVACGGGLVVCAFAQVARRAEGIDITPAMLERARQLAADKKLTNTNWRQGDGPALSGRVVLHRHLALHLSSLPGPAGRAARDATGVRAGRPHRRRRYRRL